MWRFVTASTVSVQLDTHPQDCSAAFLEGVKLLHGSLLCEMSSPAEHPGEEPAAASEAKVQGQGQGAFAQDTSSTGAQKVFEGLVSFSPVEGSAPSMVVMQYLWLSKERRPALALSRVEGDKTNTLVMEPEDCSELEAKDDNLHVQVAGRKCTISWNESCVIPGADVQQAR